MAKPLTVPQVKRLLLEAHKTSYQLQGRVGPSQGGRSWIDVPGEPWDYPDIKPPEIRLALTQDKIKRMDIITSTVNTQLAENERKVVHRYCGARNTKRTSVAAYCRKKGIPYQNFMKRINNICQKLGQKIDISDQFLRNLPYTKRDIDSIQRTESGRTVHQPYQHPDNPSKQQAIEAHYRLIEQERIEQLAAEAVWKLCFIV